MIRVELDVGGFAQPGVSADHLERLEKGINERAQADGVVSIRFVSDQEIQRLNRMYREKDAVTDVLSFSYVESAREGEELGEIVISVEQAQRQSQQNDLELELVDLMAHGLLHVFGYDHERAEDAKVMFPLQDSLVNEVLT